MGESNSCTLRQSTKSKTSALLDGVRTSSNRFARCTTSFDMIHKHRTAHTQCDTDTYSFQFDFSSSRSVNSLSVWTIFTRRNHFVPQHRCNLANASSDVTSVRYLISSDMEINGHITTDTFSLSRLRTEGWWGARAIVPLIWCSIPFDIVKMVRWWSKSFGCYTPTIISAGWKETCRPLNKYWIV